MPRVFGTSIRRGKAAAESEWSTDRCKTKSSQKTNTPPGPSVPPGTENTEVAVLGTGSNKK